MSSGGLCGSGARSTLTVQNGSVRGGSGVSVSGQVGPGGSVSLALQKSGVQGSAPRAPRLAFSAQFGVPPHPGAEPLPLQLHQRRAVHGERSLPRARSCSETGGAA